MTNECLVKCADYNGHKNVLFMCYDNDSRIGKSFKTIVPAKNCKYDSENYTLRANNDIYRVFGDWSVELMNEVDTHENIWLRKK